MPKERVDVLAYKQGLFETREQAKRGVMAGLVVNVINGERYDKPGEKIDDGTELKLKGEKLRYVSRGGLKLEKALAVFNLSVEDMITIDIGASTGGFTDVMLQNGAKLVYAVDIIQEKVEMINRKESPIVDKEIEEYLKHRNLNLIATTDAALAYANADFIIISDRKSVV